MDIEAIDTVNPLDYLSNAEVEEMDAVALADFEAWQAERYDPDFPYADLSEADRWALDCPHASLITGPRGQVDCEDCGTKIR